MAADRFLRAVRALENLHKFWDKPPVFERVAALTAEQKAQISTMFEDGKTQAEISRALKIAPSTVYNHVRRHMRAIKD